MRRLSFILLLVTAILPGCRREIIQPSGGNQEEARPSREMGIYMECPGMSATRGEQGNVPATDSEYTVHTLQVWVFTSDDNHEFLYYLSLSGVNQLPAPGHVRRYAIPVESEFAKRDPLPRIDVFALANASSIGCELNENSSWEEVNNAQFVGDEWFGVDNPVDAVDPDKGLPITGTRRNMALSSSDGGMVLNAEKTVVLERAVSKIRFVFCRMVDEDDPNGEKVSIQSVKLNGGQIPVREFLFTDTAPYRIGTDYEDRAIEKPGPSPIAPNEAPEKLVYAGQNAMAYDQLLKDAIEDGKLTDGGTMYLRESDKALTGSITFITDGVEHTRLFSMAAAGDFVRNHSWTVFGYFISGRKVELSINAIPWGYSQYYIDYSAGSLSATRLLIDSQTATIRNNSDGHKDVFFQLNKPAVGKFNITAPVNGKVLIRSIGDANAFLVEPDILDIQPDVDGGDVEVRIRPNPSFAANEEQEYSITLSFFVKTIDGREIDADSEINLEHYRFFR